MTFPKPTSPLRPDKADKHYRPIGDINRRTLHFVRLRARQLLVEIERQTDRQGQGRLLFVEQKPDLSTKAIGWDSGDVVATHN